MGKIQSLYESLCYRVGLAVLSVKQAQWFHVVNTIPLSVPSSHHKHPRSSANNLDGFHYEEDCCIRLVFGRGRLSRGCTGAVGCYYMGRCEVDFTCCVHRFGILATYETCCTLPCIQVSVLKTFPMAD